MFLSPRPNLIESDEGFSVEVLGRTGILYKEGKRAILVDSELLAPQSPAGIAVSRNSIRSWQAPHEGEPIDDTRREAIIDNIRRAVRFKGDDIEVIG